MVSADITLKECVGHILKEKTYLVVIYVSKAIRG